MKIDRHFSKTRFTLVKLPNRVTKIAFGLLFVALASLFSQLTLGEQNRSDHDASEDQSPTNHQPKTDAISAKADAILRRSLRQLANGPAFDAKVRETVWATGREVIGVGTYQQAGEGSGRYNLQITMYDGSGKHRLQQVSDGRLAWTRSEISGNVSLRRVDVGRLDDWVKQTNRGDQIEPRLKIGGWTEMLDRIDRDYQLRVDPGKLNNLPAWIVTGVITKDARNRILADSGRSHWPKLCPSKVVVAIGAADLPDSEIGMWLPWRFEFWSDPDVELDSESGSTSPRHLLTLIELFSIMPLDSKPPIERFRFNNQNPDVNFINDTDRYIKRYGVELTAN